MRSAIKCFNYEIYGRGFAVLVLIGLARIALGYTDPGDVAAINNLYVALGSPVLPGWIASGGDPCGEAWQGVQCIDPNINAIVLNGANLGGELGDNLGMFTSIKVIDLSNNLVGGSIPSNLPATMQNLYALSYHKSKHVNTSFIFHVSLDFIKYIPRTCLCKRYDSFTFGSFLSDNQFTGSIPSSLSTLSQLTAMSLNNNLLTGEIPDAFQTLTGLINLDLSSNNLSGHLPPSLENLSSLTTLRLQTNRFSGTLDVLQDLPLRDLNIENNLFSGPIPEKLLSIPNFKKDGNPFNASVAPLPSPTSSLTPPPAPPLSGAPSSELTPGTTGTPGKPGKSGKHAEGPSAPEKSNFGKSKSFFTTKRVVWISIASVFLFIIMVLGLVLFLPRCSRKREEADRISKRYDTSTHSGNRENPRDNGSLILPTNQLEKVPKQAVVRPKEDHQMDVRSMRVSRKPQNKQERNAQRMATIPKREDSEIDISALDMMLTLPPPPPPPPPPPSVEKVIVKPIVPAGVTAEKASTKTLKPHTSARSFTIASLQQYTNSFSPENLIGSGMLGSVYRAELPDGKLLAVKKLDKRASSQKDDEFIELVNSIDIIHHANIVGLIGFCAEHGERLLIYEYCSNGSLQDVMHSDDEFKKKLSWNARVQMALGAARALNYLHEICQPPVVHRNFKSANILLDDDLAVRVSDCGLAPLISSGSVSQLSGHLLSAYGYGAPEFEMGIYTSQSDVYSFGVVMLELLTGRRSYDRARGRGEQFLVRWAIPQLHDIDALSMMVDPSLNGKYPTKSLSNFADIISRCVQSEPEFRPLMSEVVQDMLGMIRREPPGNSSKGTDLD